jgi:hypothetical protein
MNTDVSELERISRKFSAVINHVFHHARCTYAKPLDYLKLHSVRVKESFYVDALFLLWAG